MSEENTRFDNENREAAQQNEGGAYAGNRTEEPAYSENTENIYNQESSGASTEAYNSFDEAKSGEAYETIEAESIINDMPYHEMKSDNADKKKSSKAKKAAAIVGCAVIFGIVAGAFMALTNVTVSKIANSRIKIASTQGVLTRSNSEDTDSAIADIAEQCMPSVVSITNKSVTEIRTFFGRFAQENVSSGSGIIVGKNDSELLIVTNYHVIADSQELSVIFSDSSTIGMNSSEEAAEENTSGVTKASNDADVLKAQVKGYDSDKDLAVISVKLDDISADLMSRIKVAAIGDSSKLRPGERVIAIGNALGYGKSVTTGIVSATNREVTLDSQTTAGKTVTNKFIQTDTAINAGNSGGALLNMNGELVGINSVKIVSSGVEGMGYAIPISDVESIIDELMIRETREVVDEDKQGFLGITFEDVSSEIAEAYGMPVGVFVKSVTKGSAAEKAGIQKGYIITKFDNYSVNSGAELQNRLTYYKAGETKTITVQVHGADGYEEKELTITLDSKKEGTKKMENEQKDNAPEDKSSEEN